MKKVIISVAKIVGIVVIIPCSLVYFHIHRTIYKANYCLVGPTSTLYSKDSTNDEVAFTTTQDKDTSSNMDERRVYGIYQIRPLNEHYASFHQIYTSFFSTSSSFQTFVAQHGWPSAPILAMELIRPITGLSSLRRNVFRPLNSFSLQRIQLKPDEERWCLIDSRSSTLLACSDTRSNRNVREYFPQSGSWSSPSSSNVSIQVTCPKSTAVPHNEKLRQNNYKPNRNREFILSNPTTSFLILLNCGLAYYYWNYRIPVTAVCKNYWKIVYQKEIWRGFTGALAHFELLHLGFNMMSLASFGEALEEWGYGSIPFLSINISLVAFTTILMMLMTKYRIHTASSNQEIQNLQEQNTVGYSGVLFAWMVIISMEQPKTCPIFFLPDLCFESYSLYKDYIKFNVAPLVSLVAMQILLPRISFVGHLSGILCGFALHWGILRMGICVPHVWGCFIVALWLWRVEKVIFIKKEDELYTLDNIALEEEDEEEEETEQTMKHVLENFFFNQESSKGFIKSLLQITSYSSFGISIFSIMYFDLGIAFAQITSTCLFYLGSSSFVSSNGNKLNYPQVGHIFRGYIITSLLLLVTDGMSLPGWWVARNFISSNRSMLFPTNIFIIFCVSFVRIALNLFGFILATKVLADIGELSGGPCFKIMLARLLGNARIVGDSVCAPVYRAFDGQGYVVGTDSSNQRGTSSDSWIGTGIQRTV